MRKGADKLKTLFNNINQTNMFEHKLRAYLF